MNRWINDHQLLYFRAVARAGTLAGAAADLRLAPQTLSEHVQQLEALLGATLFQRSGRGMVLTDIGRLVLTFADEVHALGQELVHVVERGGAVGPRHLTVGIDDTVPRLAAWSVLREVFPAADRGVLVCREGSHAALVAMLRARVLDLVLSSSDEVPDDGEPLRCATVRDAPLLWVAAGALADALAPGFPQSLDGAPVVVAASATPLRRAIDRWIDSVGVRPRVVAEVSDPALAKTMCADGLGATVLPEYVVDDARRRYELCVVGRCEGVAHRVYALTARRLHAHADVEALFARAAAAAPEAASGIS